MIAMAKRRNPKTDPPAPDSDPEAVPAQGDRHRNPRVAFHLPQKMLDAVDRYIRDHHAGLPVSAVLRLALGELLVRKGYLKEGEVE